METLSYPKNKIKIVLLENIHPKAIEIFKADGYTNLQCLAGALNNQDLINHIQNAHVVGIRSGTHITKDILSHCQKILTIGCFCIGTNQVDLSEAMLHGIPVFNDPHSNSRSVAEMVIGLCVGLMRDLFNKNADAQSGKWNKRADGSHELRGKILGIIGYGKIGSQVSILAESLGMLVCYFDIEQKLSLGNVKSVASFEELLSISDIVTLHVPETKLTRNMINAETLKLFKKDAFLINTSRGSVVDLDALAHVLDNKLIKGAAIDVFQNEPEDNTKPFKNPLQGRRNAVLTPHIGGATEEAQENIAIALAYKLINFINRGSTEGATNFPALSLPPNEDSHRILHIHENKPGMLSQINKIFADRGINILAQYLKTMQDLGFVVFDIQKGYEDNQLMEALKNIPGTIRARILY